MYLTLWNPNGLSQEKLNWLTDRLPGWPAPSVFAFAESHMAPINKLPPNWQIYRNPSRHHGVALISHKSLNPTIIFKDDEFRVLLFSIEGPFGLLTIFLGYWPATSKMDRKEFSQKHKDLLLKADIILGDFNSCLDWVSQSNWTSNHGRGGLKKILRSFQDPVDFAPPGHDGLFTNHHGAAVSRIDRAHAKPYVPLHFVNNMPFPRKESHCPVVFELRSPRLPRPGWRLSPSLFTSHFQRKELKDALSELTVEDDSTTSLKLLLSNIQETVKSLQFRLLKMRRRRFCRAKDLLKRIPAHAEARKELEYELQLFADHNRARKLSISSTRKIFSNETPDSFLTRQLHARDKDKNITRIMHPTRKTVVEGPDVLSAFEAFYRDLYTKVEINQEVLSEFLTPWSSRLSEEEADLLARPFELEELEAALKSMKDLKAPGNDGIPALPYKLLPLESKEAILKLFNRLLDGEPVPEDWKEGLVTTLFKKGDALLISNRRPITLLPTIYKVLTKLIASRINGVLPALIHEDQVGFIPRRLIFDNVLTADYVLSRHETWATSIDFEKAYDSVSHECIRRVLLHIRLPENLRFLIDDLITGSKARVRVDGALTNPFPIDRGVKQGDPLSPLLFALCIEPLAHRIRKETKGIQVTPTSSQQILLYADDILMLGESPEDQLEQVKILMRFKEASGLKMNVEKSFKTPSNDKNKSLIPNVPDIPSKGIRYLGFQINNKGLVPIDMEIVEKVEAAVKKWRFCSRNTRLKATVLKTYVMSKVWYFSFVQDMSGQSEKLSKLMREFLWTNKYDGTVSKRTKMRPERAGLPPAQGGLGVYDLVARFKAQLVWVADMVMGRGGKIGSIWKENFNFSPDNKDRLTGFPPKIALDCWDMYHQVPEHCRNDYEEGPEDIPSSPLANLKEWTGVFSNNVGPIRTDRQLRLLETKNVDLIQLFQNCKRMIRDVSLRDFAWNYANGTLYYRYNYNCPCGETNRDTEHITFTCRRNRCIINWLRETDPFPDCPTAWEEGQVLRTITLSRCKPTVALLLGAISTAWICRDSPIISRNIWEKQVQLALQSEWWYAIHHPDHKTIPKNLLQRFKDAWQGRYSLNRAGVPLASL